ncbi:hypothetical protein ACRALDRAFT_213183 [Sodiomyces alcalophilus JCM 7366]|uniref:uncharacterized protein n=1 Tax=Sodiomyces alcalophilus JCM 7366 TaxID=591952 RepID=UPI0039B60B50
MSMTEAAQYYQQDGGVGQQLVAILIHCPPDYFPILPRTTTQDPIFNTTTRSSTFCTAGDQGETLVRTNSDTRPQLPLHYSTSTLVRLPASCLVGSDDCSSGTNSTLVRCMDWVELSALTPRLDFGPGVETGDGTKTAQSPVLCRSIVPAGITGFVVTDRIYILGAILTDYFVNTHLIVVSSVIVTSMLHEIPAIPRNLVPLLGNCRPAACLASKQVNFDDDDSATRCRASEPRRNLTDSSTLPRVARHQASMQLGPGGLYSASNFETALLCLGYNYSVASTQQAVRWGFEPRRFQDCSLFPLAIHPTDSFQYHQSYDFVPILRDRVVSKTETTGSGKESRFDFRCLAAPQCRILDEGFRDQLEKELCKFLATDTRTSFPRRELRRCVHWSAGAASLVACLPSFLASCRNASWNGSGTVTFDLAAQLEQHAVTQNV